MITAWDLFCGGGGSTTGATLAGARVTWAANHNRAAIDFHARNHPSTVHACQDLQQCSFRDVSADFPDLLLASPACQGHRKASTAGGSGKRASAPKHDADRATAWAVVTCLEVTRAPVAVVENVVEFRKWVLFPAWCAALRDLGYALHEHVVQAADLGVPQLRERLFLTAVRASSPLVLELEPEPRVPARSILVDTDRGWKPVADLPPNARRRIGLARERYGREFLAHYVSDDRGHSLDEPMHAVTTKHQWALVRGKHRRMLVGREYARAQSFPDSTVLTGKVGLDCFLTGNAVPPRVMQRIVAEVIARA